MVANDNLGLMSPFIIGIITASKAMALLILYLFVNNDWCRLIWGYHQPQAFSRDQQTFKLKF